MNNQQLLAYLKSGGWGGYQPAKADKPITLGPKTFGSHYAARRYVKTIIDCCPEGQEITDDDALILSDVVKHSKHYSRTIEPSGILGFTVKDHPMAGNKSENVKILVVVLAAVTGRYPRTRLADVDVSIRDCFDNMQMSQEVKQRVVRQDDNEWVIPA